MGRAAEIDTLFNALVNGPAVQLTRYPLNANGLVVTGDAAGGFAYKAAGANQVQIVAAGVNAAGMWICGGGLTTPNTMDQYVLWIGRGTIPVAVRAAEISFNALVTGGAAAGVVVACIPVDVTLPFPLFVRAGVGIAVDAANLIAAAETARASILVATGLGA